MSRKPRWIEIHNMSGLGWHWIIVHRQGILGQGTTAYTRRADCRRVARSLFPHLDVKEVE